MRRALRRRGVRVRCSQLRCDRMYSPAYGRDHFGVEDGGHAALLRGFFVLIASPSMRLANIAVGDASKLALGLNPTEAEKLNPRDWPRVQRAIEFYLQTGERISRQRPLRPEPPSIAS